MTNSIFLKEKQLYKRDLDPVNEYFRQAARYLETMTGRNYEECLEFVKTKFKNREFPNMRNPTVIHFERGENGDREKKETPLTDYIYRTVKDNDIIVPSGTVYCHPSKKASLITKFTDTNTARRSTAKKESFKAKAEKDMTRFVFKDNEQTNMKLSNNSLSGAFVAMGSFVNNPSAHSTLTSTTRTGTSLANASNERLIAGNRHYFAPHIVLFNLISIIERSDIEAIERGMHCEALIEPLVYPSVQDVMDCITYSSNNYWRDFKELDKLKNFVVKLTPVQRAAFVYTGDFYHIRKHNDTVMRTFIREISAKCQGEVTDPLSVIKQIDEQVLIFAHMVCADEVKGFGKDYAKMEAHGGILDKLIPTALNILDVISRYKDFIQAFFLTDNVPPSVSHIRDMVRRVVVISDTDSTCFCTGEWVEWYRGKIWFDSESLAVSAAITFLATQTFLHTMALYSANINVDKVKLHTLAYKSEWTWTVVTPMNVAKHYFARAVVQEGNVFAHPELELKGVHLKNSNTPRRIVKDSTAMIEDIMDIVTANGKISIYNILKHVSDMERFITESLLKGELEFYRQVKIKEADAYSKGMTESPYQHHLLWEEVFAPKYGKLEEPPYGVAKIATTLSNPTAIKNWLENMQDRELAARMAAWLTRNKKTSFNTFYVSTNFLRGFGMPEEIKPAIDTKRIILDLCNIYYLIIESLGFYKKVDFTLTELGY